MATAHEIGAIERLLKIKKAREHLIDFIEYTMPDPDAPDDIHASQFKTAPHHLLLCEALERVERGECLRLAISMPPQHGKSETASRRFIAWLMGRAAHRNVMFATYNDTFAGEFGSDVREIMQSKRYADVFPEAVLRKDSKSKDLMTTTKRGKMAFIGRGGSGTGKPADFFLIDDPLKNAEEAASPTTVRALHEWFAKVAFTRCHAGSAIVIIHTRWIEDDLIGRFCDPDHPEHDPDLAAMWDYINIPAVVGEGRIAKAMNMNLEVQTEPAVVEAFGTEPIAALWPTRFPLRHLAEAKKINPRGFEALYQGKPTPDDGDYFKLDWLVEYDRDELPANLRRYGASDHAVSEKQYADRTVLGCVGVDEQDDIWVLPDVVWRRMETDVTVEEMIAQMRNNRPFLWWAEDDVIRKAIGPFLLKRMAEEKVYTVLSPKTPSKDKQIRARSIQGRMAMKKVRFPKFAPWWPEARSELLKFPMAAHDDFVDWLSWIGLGLLEEVSAEPVQQKSTMLPYKAGSIAWIKQQAAARDARQRLQRAAQGF